MDASRPKPDGGARRWRPWVAALLIIFVSGLLWAGLAVLVRLAR
jgi:hypothetical protein